MAWAYCYRCEAPIGPPDVRDVIRGKVICHCGEEREVDDDYKDDLLVQMHEDIAMLQNQVKVLTKAVKMLAKR